MKRSTFSLCFCCLCCLLFGQSRAEVNYLSETDETLTSSVMVYADKKRQAKAYAKVSLIHALIFEGVDGSRRRSVPYVHDEVGSLKSHFAFFHDLFDEGGYRDFVESAKIIEKVKTKYKHKHLKNKKEKCYIVRVCVNLLDLKQALVYHNIISQFGIY